MGTDQVAVVRGEHDDGVLRHARLLERLEDRGRWPGRPACAGSSRAGGRPGRPAARRASSATAATRPPGTAGRPANESRLRRRLVDVGHACRRAGGIRSSCSQAEPGEGDVVRVDERCDGQPRPVAARRRQLVEELDHLLGEDAVAHAAAVGLAGTVRLASDPAGEPVGVADGPLAGRRPPPRRIRPAVVVRRHQRLVGARGSTGRRARCATCRGSASRSRRPGTSRRGSAPSRGRASPWRDRWSSSPCRRSCVAAVQGGVLPGEQRGPAREAGRRPGVVAVELEAAVAGATPAPASCSRRKRATASDSYGGG